MTNVQSIFDKTIESFHVSTIKFRVLEKTKYFEDKYSKEYKELVTKIILEIQKEKFPKFSYGFFSKKQLKYIKESGNNILNAWTDSKGNPVKVTEVCDENKPYGVWNDYVYKGLVYLGDPNKTIEYNTNISKLVYKSIFDTNDDFDKSMIEKIENLY